MFEEVMGIPAHPLLVHAAVVFVPLLALLAVGYAFVPVIRPHTRWVLGLLAVGAPISALFAKLSGDAFFERMRANGRVTEGFVPVLEEHQSFGDMTLYASLVLGVLALALVYVVAPRAAAAQAAAGAGRSRVVSLALGALTLIAAGVSLYYVFRTGDSGAKAVWEGS
ncbi:hypothetical protein O7627_34785 [Solwaraspora sp. WMMD1047]|uniref:DUF2231 domain-containing protein n=1 Tax=Solwaraspora sp. WMMD1047 TaxID=3016102 RepID=UPI0024176BFB|nr:DUF2231 domain-containing protein [Solwaraspora sp. WMMD1047]MDG4834437.1 hypothetical protein [Solwaraspora sp. WMMD1047]